MGDKVDDDGDDTMMSDDNDGDGATGDEVDDDGDDATRRDTTTMATT